MGDYTNSTRLLQTGAQVGIRREGAVAALLLMAAALLVVGPDAVQAQSSRRGPAPAKPKEAPLPLSYEEDVARCAPQYYAALQSLLTANPQPLATVKASRQALPQLKGRWVFHQTGERRRERDGQGRRVEGNQVCVEEIQHGGRSRCARWEPFVAPPVRASTVPTPPPSREEGRLIAFIAEFVSNRGSPPEFLSNGRYTILTDRVAGDLEAYLTQPAHPAMCAGAPEFAEFLTDQLAILKKRTTDVYETRAKAHQLVGTRVAALRVAVTAPPEAIAAAPNPEQPSPQPVSTAAASLGPEAAVREIAKLVLTPAEAAAVGSETWLLGALGRINAALATDTECTAPDAIRAEARAALRTVETAYYIDLMAGRYVQLESALFGNLDGVRKAHEANCTCGK